MLEVTISIDELQGLQCPAIYIQNKLRQAGVPISGFFSMDKVSRGMLTKETLVEGKIIKYIWSE